MTMQCNKKKKEKKRKFHFKRTDSTIVLANNYTSQGTIIGNWTNRYSGSHEIRDKTRGKKPSIKQSPDTQ